MLWMKLFPCLGYFPALGEIPAPLVDHVRKALDLATEVVPGYDHDRTLLSPRSSAASTHSWPKPFDVPMINQIMEYRERVVA